ncbi:MAG: hypothetical protein ABSH48_06255 [Verrucomicrobiota bacterium]|jgi:hypothetical protein
MKHIGHLSNLPSNLAWTGALLAALGLLAPRSTEAIGTWTALAHTAPAGIGVMLLLSDGTVMAQDNGGNAWYRLIPDGNGSYVNGTWTNNIAAMHDTRTFYSSEVLKNGQVFVAGGEYGTGGAKAEVYDPAANGWTLTPTAGVGFSDSESELLPGGNVLVAPVSWVPFPQWVTFIFNPGANAWTEGPTNLEYQDEATWVKLPDDSIVTLDPFGYLSSERYIPALNQWIADAVPPAQIFSLPNNEIGPGFMLADGEAFFIGGTGRTLFYTPSGSTSPGNWTLGPVIPNGRVAQDAPGAMMNNGKIFFEASSASSHTPVYFYEYDPVANSFSATGSPGNGSVGSSLNTGSDNSYMLDLPDGTVLYSYTSSQLYVYKPDGSPLAAGQPTIYSVAWNTDGSLHLTGTLFDGISKGADYGDDAQMGSNYPLVRFTDGSGDVYYGRTYNWSSTSVQTGGEILTTEVTVPAAVFDFPGIFSLQVVANGNASAPVTFYSPVWVDFNYTGAFQFGWFPFPYDNLPAGVSAVSSGGTIAVEANVQPSVGHETVPYTISTPMTIISVFGPSTIGN